jgi:hypothetical protein
LRDEGRGILKIKVLRLGAALKNVQYLVFITHRPPLIINDQSHSVSLNIEDAQANDKGNKVEDHQLDNSVNGEGHSPRATSFPGSSLLNDVGSRGEMSNDRSISCHIEETGNQPMTSNFVNEEERCSSGREYEEKSSTSLNPPISCNRTEQNDKQAISINGGGNSTDGEKDDKELTTGDIPPYSCHTGENDNQSISIGNSIGGENCHIYS